MSTRSNTVKGKKGLSKNNIRNSTPEKASSNELIKTKEEKMLEKIEKYVDKNRERTSKEIAERKSKRPVKKYQEGEIELMISRIKVESKPKEKVKQISKEILYIIYAIIFIVVLAFVIKYFFVRDMPQIL